MLKYKFEYCGKAKSFTFGLFGKNGHKITLSRSNKYYTFDRSDILTTRALKYYRSLLPEVKLIVISDQSNVAPKTMEIGCKKNVFSDMVETLPSEIIDTISLVKNDNTIQYAEKVKEDIESEVLSEHVECSDTSDNISKAEICEYIDMKMSDEEIRHLAEELGTNVKRLRSKDSMIARLVEEHSEDLIKKFNL